MKVYIALISGCCLGFLAGFVSVKQLPALGITISSAEASSIQPDAPLEKAEPIRFTNEDEGFKLQVNTMIDYKGYETSEGKKAELFKLNNQCKIRVTIGGEESLNYRTFYFSNQQLNHAIAATYHYPNDDLTGEAADQAFTQALFSEETLNAKNPQVVDEFSFLKTQFTPEQVASC